MTKLQLYSAHGLGRMPKVQGHVWCYISLEADSGKRCLTHRRRSTGEPVAPAHVWLGVKTEEMPCK
jgi:hypothetical protein